MTVPQRHPGNTDLKVALISLGITLAVGMYGIAQVGQKMRTGEWLPSNPGTWVRLRDWEWTGWHTAVAVLVAVVLLTQIIATGRITRHLQAKREHVDAKAPLLGQGKELSLKAVTAKNKSAKYTTADEVGEKIGVAIATGLDMWADWRSTILAIMNPGGGKTSALAIPWILKAPGWVYATANKSDLYLAVRLARERRGQFWCFDPQKVADAPATMVWNPLTYIHGPGRDCASDADTKAIIQANLFADAARTMDAKTDGFFEPAGIDLLSDLLLAAAVDNRPITDVVYWINNPNQGAVPIGILRKADWKMSASRLGFAFQLNDETKRGVFANAAKVVNFLFNREALQWIVEDPANPRPVFDPHEFVRSGGDTLISLSKEGVGSLGPLVAALTVAVTEAAQEYAKTCRGGRIDPTGVMILDEAANVARIKMLPDWYSHFASQGIFMLVILQSRAQGRSAWGQDGIDKMSGASTHRLYGRGIDDMRLLEDLSKLCGPYDERTYSRSNSKPSGIFATGHGSKSVNDQFHRVPILEPADIAALPDWRMLVQFGGGRPVLGRLLPYFLDEEMDAVVRESIETYGPKVLVTV